MTRSTLTPTVLHELREVAEDVGVLGLRAVSLGHPGFAAAANALDTMIDEGRHGEMDYLQRTRDVRRDPTRMLPGARTLLVGVAPHAGTSSPVARYAQHRDYHEVIHERLIAVEDALKRSLPGVGTQICVDSRPILERAAAALANVGFLGKNGCLIVPGLGSYLLIGAVLTTARWVSDAPANPKITLPWDACGSCTRCLDSCPTDAFVEAGVLDARRCISYLTIEHRGSIEETLAEKVGERIAGCDVCQEVCPYNASDAIDSRVPATAWIDAPAQGTRTFDIEAIANLGSSPYRALVRHTPLTRIPRRQLRRNALIALGNRRGPLAPEESDAIDRAATDREPLVSEAAAFADKRRRA